MLPDLETCSLEIAVKLAIGFDDQLPGCRNIADDGAADYDLAAANTSDDRTPGTDRDRPIGFDLAPEIGIDMEITRQRELALEDCSGRDEGAVGRRRTTRCGVRVRRPARDADPILALSNRFEVCHAALSLALRAPCLRIAGS
jgi:hypothetical protein